MIADTQVSRTALNLRAITHEHELLTAIINSLPHYIVWADRNLVLQGCNERYAQAVGLDRPADILGLTRAQLPLVAPHLAEHYDEIDRRIMETRVPALRLRETQLGPQGEERLYRVNRVPLQFSDSGVDGILIMSEDITDEEAAARKIREDEERWVLGLEVNCVGVWDFDLVDRTVIGSRHWAELTGLDPLSPGQHLPLPASQIHADDLPRFKADWDALLAATMPALECGLRFDVGAGHRYMRLRARVVRRDPAGQPLRVVGTIVDIHEPTLKLMQAANANKLESIGQLAAGIAHEINTPTQYVGDNVRFLGDAFESVQTCIDNLTHLIIERGDTVASKDIQGFFSSADIPYLREEIPKAIAQSLDGIKRIAQIVGAMKEFSHPGQERTPTDLNHAIANTIVVATNEWKYVATIATDFDPGMPQVPVMPGEFNQVILNIIVNAAHAIAEHRPGESKGTIRVSTRHSADWAEIRIEDDGCGMPPHVQAKIFDPFFTTKPVGKGTGQGLSIAHNVIVTKHRGTIAVNSEPGRGTLFTIRVPLRADDPVETAG
ncbi:MAG: ATP-binding protein [Steroidobacteraceae bacterium]